MNQSSSSLSLRLFGQFEDGLRAEDEVLGGDQVVRLDVDFLREGLGGDQREAWACLVFPAVGECGLVSCVLVEFFEGVVVDVGGELLGLGGGDVVDFGA